MLSFDFQQLSAREKYKILIGSVVPRPIALVTTLSAEGRANAAPFSFFNALSADPPILALGVENYSDLSPKDTTLNIRHNQEFTVNIVSNALVEAMNVCAVPFEPGFDELVAAGLTAIPGTRVGCPRIGEAPVALECRRMMALSIGQSREIILGEVLMATCATTRSIRRCSTSTNSALMPSGVWAGMVMRARGGGGLRPADAIAESMTEGTLRRGAPLGRN